MNIASIIKFSVIDYPSKLCCVIFTQGCNLRCPYCHNPELLEIKRGVLSENEIFEFLYQRIGKIEAVVITGGEPTLNEDLAEFIKRIKKLDFLIKLDTNGTNPKILEELINERLVDYVAMDIKAPLEKYEILGLKKPKSILESINIILTSELEYEFRTTFVKKFLNIEDFEKIGRMISGAKKFVLQKFVKHGKIVDQSIDEKEISKKEIELIISIMNRCVKITEVRI